MNEQLKTINWEDIPREQLNEKLARKIISGEKVMLTQIFLEEGGVVPWHSHENEQISYVVSGELKFWFQEEDSEPIIAKSGEVVVIPSGIPHKVEVLKKTFNLDIFSPPREDWLTGTDQYLREK